MTIWLVQILSFMKSADRIIKKTQPEAQSLPKRLCSQPASSSDVADLDIDPEIFDDSDFYQLLLREFLEASNSAAGALPTAERRKRAKPTRDRNGSKGRRLRYDVQVRLITKPSFFRWTF